MEGDIKLSDNKEIICVTKKYY